jgi:hypothetical protein
MDRRSLQLTTAISERIRNITEHKLKKFTYLKGKILVSGIFKRTIMGTNAQLSPYGKRKLFLDREDYQTCHIQLPDDEGRLAAIAIQDKLFSLFKIVSDRNKALDILARLYDAGNNATITEIPKGFSIWIEEPAATRIPSSRKTTSPNPA